MSETLSFVHNLRRPKLLLNAARHGLRDYNSKKMLKRLFPHKTQLNAHATVDSLISTEESLEQSRQAGDAAYAPSRHIEVLVALLAEVHGLHRRQPFA